MSNVPALQITPTGISVPQSVDIRAGVLADTNEAFGGELDIVTPSTPQAFLADNLTQNIVDANASIAFALAMVDPSTSEGRFQDALGRIYFMSRKGATPSVVQALCTGQPGVVLPSGSLAQDNFNILWQSTNPATFNAGGQATVEFVCLQTGPVLLGIGELTRIAQLTAGWDAITNLVPAISGTNTESRTAFEQRRRESVAKNGKSTPAAIRSEVWSVQDVLDIFVYDNPTNATINYGSTNYPIVKHSVYVAALGGDDAAIARAIYIKKDSGCDMNGNTTVVIKETEGYTFPYPEYNIKFNRPDAIPVKFYVQIANNPSLPSNIIQLVKDAVIATFTGTNGVQRARIGGTIFASSFYGPVAVIAPAVSIIQIKLGFSTPTLDSVLMGIDQAPTIQASDIQVVIS